MGITNPGQEYFKDGAWGGDGTKWVKSGLPFAYGGRVAGTVVVAAADVGGNTINGDTVPANTIWCINTLEAHNNISATTAALLGMQSGATKYWVAAGGSRLTSVGFAWAGQVFLTAGDKPIGWLGGCSAGDSLLFVWTGYILRST